jgi:hypothetical protein
MVGIIIDEEGHMYTCIMVADKFGIIMDEALARVPR